MKGCVTSEKNQNLTYFDKLLLQWHFKIRYNDLFTLQWIGSQGWLGKIGEKTVNKNAKIPKCADCQYGKQEINIKSGTSQRKYK